MTKANIQKEFNCEIKKIWEIVTNNQNYAWRSDLSKIDIVDDKHFIEYTQKGYPTYFTITSIKPMKKYRLEFENTNIKGSWIGLFTKNDDNKVVLDFTEEVSAHNIIFKILAKPYLKSMQKRYMQDLEKVVNEDAK